MAKADNILTKLHDLLLYLVPQLGKFPRPSRKPTGRSLFRAMESRGTNKPTARGLVAARQLAANALAPLLALLFAFALPLRADTGSGDSALFTVDVRYGFSYGANTSGRFIVDTRTSGNVGSADSDLFTVDTRGVVVASATVSGRITDSGNNSLADVTISALQSGIVRAASASDSSGNYQLPLLPPGRYELRATKLNYLTDLRQGLLLSASQTTQQGFVLVPRPASPLSEQVVRTPEPAQTPNTPSATSKQLKLWTGTGFGSLPPDTTSMRSRMTIVLTHGWNSDPTVWAQSMASALNVSLGSNAPNILAWDWQPSAATPEPIQAMTRTVSQGEILGASLAQALGSSYQHSIHFIGHSLGTLVNSTAANYLHELPATTFDWQRTQMTLLDDAALANEAGAVLTGGFNFSGRDGSIASSVVNQGWVSPIPRYAKWIDNYVSLVGDYYSEAVNVNLKRGPYYALLDSTGVDPLTALHRYAANWYTKTVVTPNDCFLGNRISFERLGEAADLPTRSPWLKGTILYQDPSPLSAEMALIEPLTPAEFASLVAQKAKTSAVQAYLSTVDAAVGAVQTVGGATANLAEKILSGTGGGGDNAAYLSTPDYTTPAYFTSTPSPPALRPVWNYGFVLNTAPANPPTPQSAQRTGSNSNARLLSAAALLQPNTPAYAWMTVTVPTNAATLSFDFIFNGDGSNDWLAAGINGTNIFALETRFIPTNVPLHSGTISVSRYAGQTVELFFAVMGGTSTNASMTVDGIRFYQLISPVLQAAKVGNQATIAWPISAPGFVLESALTLAGTNQWTVVTNAPGVADFQYTLTNDANTATKFFRLRKP